MIDRLSNTVSIRTLEAALRGTALRHEAIAQNLANIETPGYRRRILRFEEALADALKAGSRSSQQGPSVDELLEKVKQLQPKIVEDRDSVLRADGNNVDIDQESVALATNTGRHIALLEILNREFRQIRMAIRSESR